MNKTTVIAMFLLVVAAGLAIVLRSDDGPGPAPSDPLRLIDFASIKVAL